MATKTTAAMKTNSQWFKQRLADRKLTLRGLAKHLNMDPGAMSLTLRGKRRMTTSEANQIGQLLGVPVTEVLRQAGIPVQDDVRTVSLNGTVNAHGTVAMFESKSQASINLVSAPADVPRDGFALQIRAPGTLADGWLVFCASDKLVPESAFGRLAIIKTSKETVLGILQKGYNEGECNIVLPLPTHATLEGRKVSWAAPVLWIRPH